MSLRGEKSKYDFQMPQFWDFTNTIPQKRPDESWFCPANVSGPSFPWLHKKRRRPLRIKPSTNKPAESQNQQHVPKASVPEKPTTNVFDRLSRHSTISASKKMHQYPLNEKEKRPVKPHTPPKIPPSVIVRQESEQYQLDQDTSTEPVAERVARIEKELAFNNNTPFKRSISNEESSSHPSKIQKIINAQFSSLSSKQEIPKVRPATASNTNTKPTTQAESSVNTKTMQPISRQRSPSRNRRSLYNELQIQKNGPLQQKQETLPSTPLPQSRPPSLPLHQPQVPRLPSLIPQSQPQNPHFPQSQTEPQPQSISQSSSLSPLAPPPLHDDVSMREVEAAQNDDNTSTFDFFEDLLKAKKKNPIVQVSQQSKDNAIASADDFFDNLLKSGQEKHKSYAPPTSFMENKESRDESTSKYRDNMLKTNGKRSSIKPLQQQNKENADVSSSNYFDTLLKSNQNKYKHPSPQSSPQKNQEKRGEPSFIDLTQSKQQEDHNSPSLPPHFPTHNGIANNKHKENASELVPPTVVTPRPSQINARPGKQKYTLLEDRYFTDERIAKARKALKESKERTRKWLEELSPNQPMKH
ncbi:hypothetical protein PS15p_207789 [Mucor circinelloides]